MNTRDQIKAYLEQHPTAKVSAIAKAINTTYGYAYKIKKALQTDSVKAQKQPKVKKQSKLKKQTKVKTPITPPIPLPSISTHNRIRELERSLEQALTVIGYLEYQLGLFNS